VHHRVERLEVALDQRAEAFVLKVEDLLLAHCQISFADCTGASSLHRCSSRRFNWGTAFGLLPAAVGLAGCIRRRPIVRLANRFAHPPPASVEYGRARNHRIAGLPASSREPGRVRILHQESGGTLCARRSRKRIEESISLNLPRFTS
jgi:hypothetical protein